MSYTIRCDSATNSLTVGKFIFTDEGKCPLFTYQWVSEYIDGKVGTYHYMIETVCGTLRFQDDVLTIKFDGEEAQFHLVCGEVKK